MVVPSGAVPCNCGSVSSVVSPLLSGSCTGPTLSETVSMVAAGGGVVSTVRVKPADGALALPAASLATTVNVCCPFTNGVAGVKVHAPPLLTTAVPISCPSRRIVTVEPGSPVPFSVGSVSLVVSLVSSAPVRPGTSSMTCVMAGAPGAAVSTVMLQVFDVPLRLLLASTAVAVSTCPPSGSAVCSVMDH